MVNKKITLKKSEEKILPFVWINGKEEEYSLEVSLKGDGSSIVIAGLFFGSRNNRVTFNTKVTHEGKNTKSLTTLRGVFFDSSEFISDGVVGIAKGATSSDGYFASKILLFDNAKGKSVPSLEIDENDLKAGHASTVGKPDAEQLFYMRSRGLSEKEATKLLIKGFFDPLMIYFPLPQQKHFQKRLAEYV